MTTTLILATLLGSVAAQGTFFCNPCQISGCTLKNPNEVIQYAAVDGFPGGSVACGLIRDRVNGVQYPPVCDSVRAQTTASANPCGCTASDGGECAYVNVNDACDLCDGKGEMMDLERSIGDDGNLPGFTCGFLEEHSDLYFTPDTCELGQEDAAKYCGCGGTTSGTSCVAESVSCKGSDTCCSGICQYRDGFGVICSDRYPYPKEEWPDWAIEIVDSDEDAGKDDGINGFFSFSTSLSASVGLTTTILVSWAFILY